MITLWVILVLVLFFFLVMVVVVMVGNGVGVNVTFIINYYNILYFIVHLFVTYQINDVSLFSWHAWCKDIQLICVILFFRITKQIIILTFKSKDF